MYRRVSENKVLSDRTGKPLVNPKHSSVRYHVMTCGPDIPMDKCKIVASTIKELDLCVIESIFILKDKPTYVKRYYGSFYFYLGLHYFHVNMFFFCSSYFVHPFYQSCNFFFTSQHFFRLSYFLLKMLRVKRPVINNKYF